MNFALTHKPTRRILKDVEHPTASFTAPFASALSFWLLQLINYPGRVTHTSMCKPMVPVLLGGMKSSEPLSDLTLVQWVPLGAGQCPAPCDECVGSFWMMKTLMPLTGPHVPRPESNSELYMETSIPTK